MSRLSDWFIRGDILIPYRYRSRLWPQTLLDSIRADDEAHEIVCIDVCMTSRGFGNAVWFILVNGEYQARFWVGKRPICKCKYHLNSLTHYAVVFDSGDYEIRERRHPLSHIFGDFGISDGDVIDTTTDTVWHESPTILNTVLYCDWMMCISRTDGPSPKVLISLYDEDVDLEMSADVVMAGSYMLVTADNVVRCYSRASGEWLALSYEETLESPVREIVGEYILCADGSLWKTASKKLMHVMSVEACQGARKAPL